LGVLAALTTGIGSRRGSMKMRDKLWAYLWLIALLLAFIGCQLYLITAVHFSVGLTALTYSTLSWSG
jgi:uncharacterized membrane protein